MIAGSTLRGTAFARDGWRVEHGGVAMLAVGGALVQRHGLDSWSPPHRIDHRRARGPVSWPGAGRTVCSLLSVGSLRTDWPVGTCVLADDSLRTATPSYHDDPRSHAVPVFDPGSRATVHDAWTATTATPLADGGVYAQRRGPRFETPPRCPRSRTWRTSSV